MTTMEIFSQSVRLHFTYLESEYGFVFQSKESLPFMHYIKYTKSDLMVRIGLAYRHDYIEIFIFNDIYKTEPSSQNIKHSLALTQLIRHANKTYFKDEEEYEKLMPMKVGLELSLTLLASLLKNYGDDILRGEKWIDFSN